MNGTDRRMLLRKKDLVEALGVAKSTVADWVGEFHVFIPTVKEGAVTLYKPEAIDVLNSIKKMREQNLPKQEIYALLQQQGFPVTVEEAAEDVQKALGKLDARKQLLDVMNQVGNALEKLADQEEAIEYIEKRQNTLSDHQKFLSEQQSAQDGRMTDLERTVQQLAAQLEAARTEIASTRAELEKRKKPWWKFGR
ncbi:hypothetical protein Heshes_26790 [Alicyclobacillus hesperidum]|uniref:HTH merR-type domain-containing protein n=1 Tax=Alicyclobacillus hesperidum TaxID=89784 RepID=A0AA37X560_9BACL|nr:MerR family transcriptional regulator [Alicyclobacillus hesperidum]GLV14993.1 hypothetical protein Heshes_26790 [Alicyclobacillus hesperidum]